MKFTLYLLLIFTALINTAAFAGDPVFSVNDKCGFVQHSLYLKSKDPGFEQRQIQDENILQQALRQMSLNRQSSINTIYTIPVVVHIVYNTSQQNITDAQVQSQIDVLNEDFGRYNSDTGSTPTVWKPIAAATDFQFCLARTNQQGQPTTGIERRQNTSVTTWTQNDDVKHFATGGLDAWDVNEYLNIWVCNLGSTLLGYGEFPASIHTDTYGVVIQYDAFGRGGSSVFPYNKGRTCTHEISHCFRLAHIWGDDGGLCITNGGAGDFVGDTPDQADHNYGCHNFPHLDACATVSPGVMCMNYMDYSDDRCLNMFTAGQAARMLVAITAYYPTLKTATACTDVSAIKEMPNNFQFNIYPNPTNGVLNLDMYMMRNIGNKVNLNVMDILGNVVMKETINNPNGNILPIDLTHLQSGVYFFNLENDRFNKTVRFTLTR